MDRGRGWVRVTVCPGHLGQSEDTTGRKERTKKGEAGQGDRQRVGERWGSQLWKSLGKSQHNVNEM